MEEFRVIISTMKEFKEYLENLPRRGRLREPLRRRHHRLLCALRSLPKPGTEQYAADPGRAGGGEDDQRGGGDDRAEGAPDRILQAVISCFSSFLIGQTME